MRILTAMTAGMLGLAPPVLAQDVKPAGLQSMMMFRSFVQDHAGCDVTVTSDGQPVFADAVAGSAASSCPDAFAWVQFASAIQEGFWQWSRDDTIWLDTPLPKCEPGIEAGAAQACCPEPAEGAGDGNCPYIPDTASGTIPFTPGTPSSIPNHGSHSPIAILDPGRSLRDHELELIFRNGPMLDYIYERDLFSTDGLGALYTAQQSAVRSGDLGTAQELRVQFPLDAVMVKADFIAQDVMEEFGLIGDMGNGMAPNNPDAPYVVLSVDVQTTDDAGETVTSQENYYLVAMTNASKDLPIWHWYAMEHVHNLGRCDYIGCNDSFGYVGSGVSTVSYEPEDTSGTGSVVVAQAEYGSHYTPPKMILAGDGSGHPLFLTGEQYLGDADYEASVTPSLSALFEGMGIGTGDDANGYDLFASGAGNPAWRSYRLKGTQSTFTTPTGVPTGTGATVTEGGFVNSASCATCHSQAAVDATGHAATPVGSTWRPNLLGYAQVAMGSPDPDMFYNMGGPSLTAATVDFVWGVLNASCIPERIDGVPQKDSEGDYICQSSQSGN